MGTSFFSQSASKLTVSVAHSAQNHVAAAHVSDVDRDQARLHVDIGEAAGPSFQGEVVQRFGLLALAGEEKDESSGIQESTPCNPFNPFDIIRIRHQILEPQSAILSGAHRDRILPFHSSKSASREPPSSAPLHGGGRLFSRGRIISRPLCTEASSSSSLVATMLSLEASSDPWRVEDMRRVWVEYSSLSTIYTLSSQSVRFPTSDGFRLGLPSAIDLLFIHQGIGCSLTVPVMRAGKRREFVSGIRFGALVLAQVPHFSFHGVLLRRAEECLEFVKALLARKELASRRPFLRLRKLSIRDNQSSLYDNKAFWNMVQSRIASNVWDLWETNSRQPNLNELLLLDQVALTNDTTLHDVHWCKASRPQAGSLCAPSFEPASFEYPPDDVNSVASWHCRRRFPFRHG
ncbi:hypothetical protein C8J56DRAFT_1058362 [Mycena floridula]|nr:hypothetical protein C8J56DRAFT_1058362 [Mycena floridula]